MIDIYIKSIITSLIVIALCATSVPVFEKIYDGMVPDPIKATVVLLFIAAICFILICIFGLIWS
jgi:hypothetical protein